MPQDQWKKKKQSKDQAKAAKMGKLDPDSELNRSAKEELEERARNKRKLRELEAEDEDNDGSGDDESDISVLAGIEREKPGEGLKKKKVKEPVEDDEPSPKKVKVDEDAQLEAAEVATPNTKSSKELKREEKKAAKKQKLAEKLEKLGVPKQTEPIPTPKKMSKEERKAAKKSRSEEKQKTTGDKTPSKPKAEEEDDSESEDDTTTPHQLAPQTAQPSTEADVEVELDDDMAPIDVSGLADEDSADATPDSSPNSPVFDPKNTSAEPTSTTTSISSTVPPSEKPRYIKLPADTTALRVRLEAKLEALRAARKATGEEGQQVRTRSDLIEQRREKQIQRRAHKREMRLKAKEEEDRKREEALTSSRNSPMSMLSPMITNDADDSRTANHFSFGRLAFSDGTQMASDLSYEKGAANEKKGPSDPKTALAKLEAQKKRIAGLDEDKRKEVLEKETWLAARRRAEGEKVHDNENLLKKAVKRKEKAKAKSEAAWKERADGVGRAIKDKQRKREDNLKKRREEKGGKGKKKKGGVSKPKARPGFEGSFGGGGKRK